ncbi:MAG: CoA transferase [Polyangiaceae bacterium]
MAGPHPTGPLTGLRVLEMGQLVAGPFAGALLAYFGADVIKIEPPEGDPLRGWRTLDSDGKTSLWWRTIARNKRSIAVDLRREDGRAIARALALRADVLLENFRPGTMEAWGLGPDELARERPSLVYARVSGFGQTGPERDRPGFASVCEAVAGLRYLTGEPGRTPVRSNLSLGDTLGGLHALIGLLLALYHRERTGEGQVVDIALTESVLNVLEGTLVEYDRAGVVREPSGPTITGVVPSNTYVCLDGLVVLGANTDKLFATLMRVVERPDMAADPALAQNPGRVARARDIDEAIASWTSRRTISQVVAELGKAGVPAGAVRDAKAISEDPQFLARDLFETVDDSASGPPRRLPAMWPRLARTPGKTLFEGPALGEHTREILAGELGWSSERIDELLASRVIR